MSNQILFPLVILLTHRRGAAIGVFKNDIMLSTNESNRTPENQFIFTRVIGQTAENLLNSYLEALSLAKIIAQDVKTLAVGTGPGSFTGIRLGCAFANGIKLGQNCRLIPLKTQLVPYFLNEYVFSNEEQKQEFKNQLGAYEMNDESTGYVTFFDVLDAVQKLKTNSNEVDILEANYGREPSPVLKLKGIKNEF